MRHFLRPFRIVEDQINQHSFQLLARSLPTFVANPLRSLHNTPRKMQTLRFPALLRSV
jgi:hypothetical protein